MDATQLTAVVTAVAAAIAGAVAAYKKVVSGPVDDTPRGEAVLLDRIEDLTSQLQRERERADGLADELSALQIQHRAEMSQVTSQRNALADRVTVLEGQLALVLALLRPNIDPITGV